MFSGGLAEDEKLEIADRHGFEMVDGPGPMESYLVRVRPRDGADLDAVVERWCNDASLRFCQRIVRD